MKRLHFFLHKPTYDWIKEFAAKTGLTVSEIIRRAIDDYKKRQK